MFIRAGMLTSKARFDHLHGADRHQHLVMPDQRQRIQRSGRQYVDKRQVARGQEQLFVDGLDDDQQLQVASILSTHEKLVDTRRNRSAADPFVIALARSYLTE